MGLFDNFRSKMFYNIFIKKGSSSIDPILGGKKLIPIDAEPPFTILLNLIFIY